MLTANQKQVGGTHYKTPYEHWDLAIFLDMGCLEYAASKHVTRWRKKDGIEDLKKAIHYVDKLIESYEIYDLHRPYSKEKVGPEIDRFAKANDLTKTEELFIFKLCTFESLDELHDARGTLVWIIQDAIESQPGTPEDGGHYDQE